MTCVEIFRKYFIVTIRIIGTKCEHFFFNLVGLSLIITVLSKNKHAPFRTCLLRNKHLWRSGGYSYLYACVISVLD